MLIPELNFAPIKQGSSLIRTFHFKNKATGDMMDLTGYHLRMQFRARIASGDLIGEASDENGFFTLNYEDSDGVVVLNIPASETKNWEPGPVVYDCELAYPDGERVDTVWQGSTEIVEEVTKDAD